MNLADSQKSDSQFTHSHFQDFLSPWLISCFLAGLSILIVTAGCSPSKSPPKSSNTGLIIQKDADVMGVPGDHAGYRFLATEPVEVLLRARAAGQSDVTVSGVFTNGQTVIFGYRILQPNLREAPQSNVCEMCVGWTIEKDEGGVKYKNTLPKIGRLLFPVSFGGVETGSFGGAYNPPVPSTHRLLRFSPSNSKNIEEFSITLELSKPKAP